MTPCVQRRPGPRSWCGGRARRARWPPEFPPIHSSRCWIRSGDGKRTIALAPFGTRRMSSPIISAAQKRDSRGDPCLAALFRSFVSLLAALPSGIRRNRPHPCPVLYFTSRRFHCCGYWLRKLTGCFLIRILRPVLSTRSGRTAQSLTSIS